MTFQESVDFFEITNDRYKDVFNTIIPVEEKQIAFYIDLIKRITFIQSGYHPITNTLEEDERYYSSEDSLYTDTDSDEQSDDEDDDENDDDNDDDEDDDEHQLTTLSKSRNPSCLALVIVLTCCGLIYFKHYHNNIVL
jgi:hypothetical protein